MHHSQQPGAEVWGPSDLPQVIHTPWDDQDKQYKLIFQSESKYLGAYSKDGIHWEWDKNKNLILAWDDRWLEDTTGLGDDVGNFFYDLRNNQDIGDQNNRYIGYRKRYLTFHGDQSRRCVAISASRDFLEWPDNKCKDKPTPPLPGIQPYPSQQFFNRPVVILVPDYIDCREVRTEFYGLCGFAYKSMYLGFLWVFRMTGSVNDYDDGPICIELVTSHDGVNWRRQAPDANGNRLPILAPGPRGTWDGGTVNTPNHPLVEDGMIKLYYGGCDKTHGITPKEFGVGLARYARMDSPRWMPKALPVAC